MQANSVPFIAAGTPFEDIIRAWRWTFTLRNKETVEQYGGPQVVYGEDSPKSSEDLDLLIGRFESTQLRQRNAGGEGG